MFGNYTYIYQWPDVVTMVTVPFVPVCWLRAKDVEIVEFSRCRHRFSVRFFN